jgi:hypothetical protein
MKESEQKRYHLGLLFSKFATAFRRGDPNAFLRIAVEDKELAQRMLDMRGVTLDLTTMQASIRMSYEVGEAVQYDGYLHEESCSPFGVIESIHVDEATGSTQYLFNDCGCRKWCRAQDLLPAARCAGCWRSREAWKAEERKYTCYVCHRDIFCFNCIEFHPKTCEERRKAAEQASCRAKVDCIGRNHDPHLPEDMLLEILSMLCDQPPQHVEQEDDEGMYFDGYQDDGD